MSVRHPARRVALLLVIAIDVVALWGCRGRSPVRVHPAGAMEGRRAAARGVRRLRRKACKAVSALALPAGIYFRNHAYDPCRERAPCPPPRVAVVLGVFPTDGGAEGRAAKVAPGRLAPGYPLVVHTDELGLEDAGRDGVVVVAGLFRNVSDAHRWLEACPQPGGLALALASKTAAAKRFHVNGIRRHYAIRIRSGAAVPAYAEADLERLAHGGAPSRIKPLCHLRPGRTFVYSSRHLRWRRWAPVRCGLLKAYVRWTDTRLETVIKRRPDGTEILRQVVSVECDQPELSTWRRTPQGTWRPVKPKDGVR